MPERSKETKDGQTHRRLQLAAEAEEFLNRKGASLSGEEARRVTELDFRWLIDTARARLVPVVVITYPQVMGSWFLDANRGIEAAASATGTPVVSGAEAVDRIVHRYRSRGLRPPNLMDRSIHPAEPVYRAIGDMVFEAIERDRLLPERSGDL